MNTYVDLLKDNSWKQKRAIIVERDSNSCQKCKNVEIKKISRKATLVSEIRSFQIFDGEGVITNYNILIRDNENKSEHQIYCILQDKLLDFKISSSYNIYYCIERSIMGSIDRVYLNICENALETGSVQNAFVRGLHVHHNYYQDEKLPWDYPDEALITLCWICHEKFHANQKVEWLDKNGNKKGTLSPCDRCHGAGYFPQYNHVESGRCFKCNGARFIEF